MRHLQGAPASQAGDFSNLSYFSLSQQKATVVAVSPLVGSHCTKGEGGPHTVRGSPRGLPQDAQQCIPSAAVHGALRARVPDVLCPENGVPTKKKKKNVAFFLLRNSNIQSLFSTC